jgi:predicted AAA+ superfamily ATPase
MAGAVLLIGSPGAGKSSVLGALSAELERSRVPFGALESEQLSEGWPRLSAEDWVPQLAAVMRSTTATDPEEAADRIVNEMRVRGLVP